MTAVAEDTDLSWVRFIAGRADDGCDGWGDQECLLEAVALAWWAADRDCKDNPSRMCAAHRDALKAANAQNPGGWWKCSKCGANARLLRIEPIR